MSKRISKEELSDEDIQSILENFSNLTEEERQSRLLGEGAYKQTYSVPDKNFVIKKPHNKDVAIDDMAREYAINKRLRDKANLELPILVTQKSDDKIIPYHIQRKITPLQNEIKQKLKPIVDSPERKFLENKIEELRDQYDMLFKKSREYQKSRINMPLHDQLSTTSDYVEQTSKYNNELNSLVDKITDLQNEHDLKIKKPISYIRSTEDEILGKVSDELKNKAIAGADIHSGNITSEGKIFDLGSWVGYDEAKDSLNDSLYTLRKNIVDRTIDNPMTKGKYRILRSLLPMVGKGLLAGAAGAASLAAEASDIEGEGSLQEEQQLERDKASAKLKKSIGPDAFNKFQENIRQMSPQDLIDLDYDKPKFNTIRKKIKE